MIIGINGRQGSGKDTLGMILQALSLEPGNPWHRDPIAYVKGYQGRPNLKGGWKIVKFADKLKEIASLLLGVPREKFEGQAFKDSVLGPEWDYWIVKFARDERRIGGIFHTEDEALEYEAHERMTLRWPNSLKTKVMRTQMTVRGFLQKLGTEGLREGLHYNTWVNALFADYKPLPPPYYSKSLQDTQIPYPNWVITDMRFPNEFDEVKRRGGITVRIDRPDNPHKQSEHRSEIALDTHKFDVRFDNQFGLEGLVEQAKAILKIANTRTG